MEFSFPVALMKLCKLCLQCLLLAPWILSLVCHQRLEARILDNR